MAEQCGDSKPSSASTESRVGMFSDYMICMLGVMLGVGEPLLDFKLAI